VSAKKPTSARRRQFLDPAKITAVIAEVAVVSKAGAVKIALAGGCALQLYGSDRFTQDVDLIANGYLPKLRRKSDLTFGGTRSVASNGVSIDVIVRNDDYQDLYDDALFAAQRMAGVAIPVVTLPYLGAMKMVAGRGKDQQDLAWILTDSGVSYKELRALVKKHLGPYAADELDQVRKTAVWERKGRE
jgi:hypothetical protein